MKTIIFISTLFSILTLSANAYAEPQCICSESAFSTRWDKADAVFIGTVKNIEIEEMYDRGGKQDRPVKVELNIDKAYKTPKGSQTFYLHTSLTKNTCTGHPFQKDEKYLVFSYKREAFSYMPGSLYRFPDGTYSVGGLCGGTKILSEAGDDLNQIAEYAKKQKKQQKSKLPRWMRLN